MGCLTDLGAEQRVVDPVLRLINVEFRGHHIEIAGEHDGHTCREELRGVRGQPIEPAQLVIELRSRRGIAIWQIEASDSMLPIDASIYRLWVSSGSPGKPRRVSTG